MASIQSNTAPRTSAGRRYVRSCGIAFCVSHIWSNNCGIDASSVAVCPFRGIPSHVTAGNSKVAAFNGSTPYASSCSFSD